MKNKRTYYRDAKGRFASKPDDSSNFLKYTRDSSFNVLTYKDSDVLTREFDKFYLFWCVGFIKRIYKRFKW